MRFHADALCSFWAMMAIVMQNTAVCRVAEASLRTVRALRRPQRALQRPLRHAQSLPFPVSLIGRKAQRIPFSTICSACRFHAFCRAERWLARPFMRVPRPSSPVDGRQRLSARSCCLRAVPWLLHEAWATVFALSRVLWGSEQLFLRCKRTSIAHDVKIT